jgi:hypothetical protein
MGPEATFELEIHHAIGNSSFGLCGNSFPRPPTVLFS